jgi:DNA-binding NarL/FixJ family response regulator
VLAAEPSWEVVGEAQDGRGAVALAVVLNPDLVVLDVAMPGLNGIDATRRLRRLVPTAEVLALSMHDDESLVTSVIDAGALGYVLKSDDAGVMREAVREVLAHRRYISAALSFEWRKTNSGMRPVAPQHRLTPREREVLQLLSDGCSNKDIAAQLGISDKTAETHRARLMTKLGIHSVAKLVRYAIRNRIVDP